MGDRTKQKAGYSIMPLPKQRLIWLPTQEILGVLACQRVNAVEVEQSRFMAISLQQSYQADNKEKRH